MNKLPLQMITLALLIVSISFYGCGRELTSPNEIPSRHSATAAYDSLIPLYGDIHMHSNLSDGDESPDFVYRFARDVARLDFCALTDHAEMMADDGFVALDYYRSMVEKYDEDGKFSVLFGYEWTSAKYNHRNVYSADPTIPVLSSRHPDSDDPDKLWDLLSQHDVITIPHHPLLQTEYNWWSYHEPGVDTCIEFYSKWGNSLYYGIENQVVNADPANGILQALAEQDLRMGIVAGSDTHMSRPGIALGESRPDGTLEYDRPSFSGVWATAHTNDAITEAIKNRHCYGMMGTRLELKFSVNGAIMGSEILSEADPEIAFEITSPINVSEVIVYQMNNGVGLNAASWNPDSLTFSETWTDEGFFTDTSYLLIIHLENGDMAVSSPVWVEFAHSGNGILPN